MKSVNTLFTPWKAPSPGFPNRPIGLPSPIGSPCVLCVGEVNILYERASSRNTGHAARRYARPDHSVSAAAAKSDTKPIS